jgi:hypothetical protein
MRLTPRSFDRRARFGSIAHYHSYRAEDSTIERAIDSSCSR